LPNAIKPTSKMTPTMMRMVLSFFDIIFLR
jgi:hypothetical protein